MFVQEISLCKVMSFLCHRLSFYVMHGFLHSVRAVYLSVELTKERSIFRTTWSRRRPSVLTEYTTIGDEDHG